MTERRKWIVLYSLALLPMVGFWAYGLLDMDEGFYSAVSSEMLRRGEWLTPYYNGKPWFEKPILIYWATMPTLQLFGGEFGMRLPSVLATLGLYVVCAWFASKRLSVRAGQWVLLILCSGLLVAGLGRMAMTDALFNLVFTGAMLAFLQSLLGDRRWRVLAGFLLGVSTLAKGPVGCVIFAFVAVFVFIRQPTVRPSYRGWWLAGVVAFATAAASWYLPAYLANPDAFVSDFLIQQNVGRFQGGDRAHTLSGPQSWFFYVPVLFLGLFPWSWWIVPSWRMKGEDPLLRYLAVWAASVFAFFTASGAKLPHYILPAIPPLALMVAALFTQRERNEDAQGKARSFLRRGPGDRREGSRPWLPNGALIAVLAMSLLLNLGMPAYYRGLFPGTPDQGEIHCMVKKVLARNPDVVFASFRMGRQNKADLGTGKLKLQETELPSLIFYLDTTILKTDQPEDLAREARPVVAFTRADRMTPNVLEEIGRLGRKAKPLERGRYYEAWRIESDAR